MEGKHFSYWLGASRVPRDLVKPLALNGMVNLLAWGREIPWAVSVGVVIYLVVVGGLMSLGAVRTPDVSLVLGTEGREYWTPIRAVSILLVFTCGVAIFIAQAIA